MMRLILLVQFHNEMARLPGFLTNVLPHVDGIIGLNDGSSDGSEQYFAAQPKVLEVIDRPVRHPHVWDEPANRRALVAASNRYRPDWLLALDVDERLDNDFRQRSLSAMNMARWLGSSVISLQLFEMWDSDRTYRVDGLWGKKRRNRLFRWREDHQVSDVALHGPWTSVSAKTRPWRSDLRIYHLGMLTEAQRASRVEKYKKLDPAHRYQSIGYDYLNCKDNLRLQTLTHDRHYLPEGGAAPDAPELSGWRWRLCVASLKKHLTPDLCLSGDGQAMTAQALADCVERSMRWLLPLVRPRKVQTMVLSGWPRVGKTRLAHKLCRANGLLHLLLDPFSAIYERIRDDDTRAFVKLKLVQALLQKYPMGAVLEGADLVFDNYHRDQVRPARPTPSLTFLQRLGQDRPVSVYLIGNADESVNDKRDALAQFRQTHACWTGQSPAWADESLARRAAEIIEASRYMRRAADGEVVKYMDIRSGAFHEDQVRAQAWIEYQRMSPFVMAR